MPSLPTTTTAFGSSATEAQFKSFISDLRDYLAFLFGTDGTKSTAIATLGASPFTAGTAMIFAQSTAPTGWTKQTTHNDKALRVVSGTASSGGSVAFSTVFSRTVSDWSSLSTAQMPTHNHALVSISGSSAGVPIGLASTTGIGANLAYSESGRSANTGSSETHSHGMDIRVQYVDVIIATKD